MIMAEFWRTKRFSELSREWAIKLAESDFVDIEKELRSGERELIYNSGKTYSYEHSDLNEAKEDFFQRVSSAAILDYDMDLRDWVIMRNYSDGVKQSKTIKELEKEGLGCNRITITRTITRYLSKWKIPLRKKRKTGLKD